MIKSYLKSHRGRSGRKNLRKWHLWLLRVTSSSHSQRSRGTCASHAWNRSKSSANNRRRSFKVSQESREKRGSVKSSGSSSCWRVSLKSLIESSNNFNIESVVVSLSLRLTHREKLHCKNGQQSQQKHKERYDYYEEKFSCFPQIRLGLFLFLIKVITSANSAIMTDPGVDAIEPGS